ncbi:hypothetical protein CHS0354_002358, partial [Potamilus streckersoni]
MSPKSFMVKILSSVDGTGCNLEVDSIYPEEQNDEHKHYPLAPEVRSTKEFVKITVKLILTTNSIICPQMR